MKFIPKISINFSFRKEPKEKCGTDQEMFDIYKNSIIPKVKKICPCAYCGEKLDSLFLRTIHEKEMHVDQDGNFLQISCDRLV